MLAPGAKPTTEFDKPDVLIGGSGNDMLIGGRRETTLIGAGGNDTLVGGMGSDHYIFQGDNRGATVRIIEAANTDSDTLDFSQAFPAINIDLAGTVGNTQEVSPGFF